MAQKTIVTLIDDLTGEEAEDITTVEFALEGVTYEIDLADELPGVRVEAQGSELSELGPDEQEDNAGADENGLLALRD